MSPELFTIPGLGWPIQAYGLLLGVALVLGWSITLRLAARDRLPAGRLGGVYVVTVAVGLIAGKLGYLAGHTDAYVGPQSLVDLAPGSIASFWAITMGLIVTAFAVNRRKIPVSAWLDVVAPAFVLGLALERVGALLAGIGFGRVCGAGNPLCIRYPESSLAYAWQVEHVAALMPTGSTESLPVHPTQLYAAAAAVLAAIAATWLRKRRQFSGQIAIVAASIALVGRGFIEWPLRADASPAVMGPLSGDQVGVAVLLFALAVGYGAKARAKKPLRAWEGGRWSPKDK